MNASPNQFLTIGQVRAALQLKVEALTSTMKVEHDECRHSLYGYQSEFTSKIVNLPDVETLRKNQIEALKAFGFRKDQIDINFRLGSFWNVYPSIPSCFTDYLTGKVDTKRREFRTNLNGGVSVKRGVGENSFFFSYNSVVMVKASLVKDILLKWQDGIIQYLAFEEKFKKLTLFIKNLDAESQLVLLELQNPEAHKNLIEYTDKYLNERLALG
jgi:hypothetical protein